MHQLGEALYDYYRYYRPLFAPIPHVSEEAMARLLAAMSRDDPRLAGHQVSEWIDARYLREIEAAGLVRP